MSQVKPMMPSRFFPDHLVMNQFVERCQGGKRQTLPRLIYFVAGVPLGVISLVFRLSGLAFKFPVIAFRATFGWISVKHGKFRDHFPADTRPKDFFVDLYKIGVCVLNIPLCSVLGGVSPRAYHWVQMKVGMFICEASINKGMAMHSEKNPLDARTDPLPQNRLLPLEPQLRPKFVSPSHLERVRLRRMVRSSSVPDFGMVFGVPKPVIERRMDQLQHLFPATPRDQLMRSSQDFESGRVMTEEWDQSPTPKRRPRRNFVDSPTYPQTNAAQPQDTQPSPAHQLPQERLGASVARDLTPTFNLQANPNFQRMIVTRREALTASPAGKDQ